jgi:hypothetical protein
VRSQPLRVLLRHTNRTSSNFFAEVLGKRLGVERWGPPGTISRGARAIAAWLRARGVKVHARDSSGLSFDNRVSPRGLVTALRHARRAPWGAVLRGSLAAGGQGTLRDRLRDVRLRAKTGTLEGVSALSGWVWQPRLGRWVEFSILSTGMPKHRAVALEDRIVRVVAEVRPRPARVSALLHRPLVRGDTTGRAGHIRARVAPADEGGYGSPMAFSAFCDTCGRKVYVGERDTPVCPVCSSPLLRAVQVPESRTDEPPDQTSGSK